MASGHLTIIIDDAAPVNVILSINGGYATTVDPLVPFVLIADDDMGGQYDLRDMKVWGDLDTNENRGFATTEGAALWIPFSRSMKVLLSAGSGTKTVNAKVRDSVGNVSVTASATVQLIQPSVPQVTILVPPRRKKYSSQTGYDTVTFVWRADRAFTEYKVLLVGSVIDTEADGQVISTGTNVSGTGSWTAGESITTTVSADTILGLSSGTGAKTLKVFVKSGSTWSE